MPKGNACFRINECGGSNDRRAGLNRRATKPLKSLAKRRLRRSSAVNRRKPPHGFLAVPREIRDAAVLRRSCVRNPHTPYAPRGVLGPPLGAFQDCLPLAAVRQRWTVRGSEMAARDRSAPERALTWRPSARRRAADGNGIAWRLFEMARIGAVSGSARLLPQLDGPECGMRLAGPWRGNKIRLGLPWSPQNGLDWDRGRHDRSNPYNVAPNLSDCPSSRRDGLPAAVSFSPLGATPLTP
jgi:hypothetical protein